MTSFCNCPTCKGIKQEIKKRKHPLCFYCNEHHDSRIHCIAEMESRTESVPTSAREVQIKRMKMNLAKPDIDEMDKGLVCPYFLDVANGKYTLFQNKDGSFKALRYKEEWRDLTGDNLVFNLMVELIEAKEKIQEAIEAIPNLDCTHEYLIGVLKGEK